LTQVISLISVILVTPVTIHHHFRSSSPRLFSRTPQTLYITQCLLLTSRSWYRLSNVSYSSFL